MSLFKNAATGFVLLSRDTEHKHICKMRSKRSTYYQSITCLSRLGNLWYCCCSTNTPLLKIHYWKTYTEKCTFLNEMHTQCAPQCWWTCTLTWCRNRPGFLEDCESSANALRGPKVPAGAHWSNSTPPQQPPWEPSREMLVVLAPVLVDNCPPHTWLSLGWGKVMNRLTKWTQVSLPREDTFDQCWATYAGLGRGACRQLRKKRALL